MELKTYLAILWRRWYVVVLVPLIVAAGVLYQSRRNNPTYTATAKVSVVRSSQQPNNPNFQYDGY